MVGAEMTTSGDTTLVERAGPELAAVITKCLAPRPEDRYESTAELRADLLALQAGRPVSPLAHKHGYRFRKFVRRNPFGVGLAVALLAIIVGGVVLRTLNLRLEERKANAIIVKFVDDPALARDELNHANSDLRQRVAEGVSEGLASSAFTQRVMSARSALWAAPDAFWKSVDDGPLWRHGEWLELIDVARIDPLFVTNHLARIAADGSERQKYVAFCLIGQIVPDDSAVADLCVNAAAKESNPGVASAAAWAATRLGRTPPANMQAVRVDDLTGLKFVTITGCESFRRGSPPDEPDRYDNENMAPSGRPVQTFLLSTTEVPAGSFAKFVNAPETVAWLTRLANESPDRRESLKLFGQALQLQLDGGATGDAVGWISFDIADQYCRWLTDNAASASPPRRYRLPTEDEWEYACRAGNPGPFCFGDNPSYAYFFARCNGAEGGPAVATHMPNFFGLFDMHGNLWEWTDSRYPPELIADKTITDSQKQNLYVLRGGAYYSPAVRCRSAQRNYSDPYGPGRYFGLRVVMEESQR